MAITDPVDARGHTIADALAQEKGLMLDDDDGSALGLTGVAATDVITTDDDHGMAVGDRVRLTGLTGGAGIDEAATYVVATVPSATTFTANDQSGVALNFTDALTAGTLESGEMTLAQTGAEVQAQIDNVPGEDEA